MKLFEALEMSVIHVEMTPNSEFHYLSLQRQVSLSLKVVSLSLKVVFHAKVPDLVAHLASTRAQAFFIVPPSSCERLSKEGGGYCL